MCTPRSAWWPGLPPDTLSWPARFSWVGRAEQSPRCSRGPLASHGDTAGPSDATEQGTMRKAFVPLDHRTSKLVLSCEGPSH